MTKYANILETIGRTPAVRVTKLAPEGINLYVKIEAFNPMGSVKDRLALGIIEDAERSGRLTPGQTVIEATSGNTGIGLAMVCAHKGYPLVVTMAESFSIERRKMMRFFGAKVVLTPASEKGTGMVAKAEELAEKHDWFLCRQFENEANADMHSKTTAVEILEDFRQEGLDYWVTGFGTGGTLKGVARVLADRSPNTKIIVCEPDNVPILSSGIPQPRADDGSPSASHPSFRPHMMQGWSPDFIPSLVEDVVAMEWIDEIVPISGADAMRLSQELAQKEGIFVGTSSGATFSGALKVCESAPKGATILCMLPDTGERYLSTPLFENIPTEMTDDEIELSRSTPSCRFDAQPSAVPPPQAAAPAVIDAAAEEFLKEVIADKDHPVVLFALEWCEFCWSVRKMFSKFEIPYRAVDLDSVAYQQNDRGGKIRTALNAQFSVQTIPQIFVGGQLVGGCTEVFDAFKAGRLQTLLENSGVAYDKSVKEDPYSFLPSWLHPR
ncbi:MAG: cysteine synthase A [Gammaproteobacteria bacterium]|nr:MAG: cysteine synthase A [Gammaproteobacteria bacterium]